MTKQAVRLCRKGCNCSLQGQEYKRKVSVYCGTPVRARDTMHPASGACLLANLTELWLFHIGNWKIHFSFKKCYEPAGGKVHSKPCRRGGIPDLSGTVRVGMNVSHVVLNRAWQKQSLWEDNLPCEQCVVDL